MKSFKQHLEEGKIKDFFKSIGNKIAGKFMDAAAQKIVDELDKPNVTVTEFYMFASSELSGTDFKNVKLALDHYLKKNKHKKAEQLLQLMKKGQA